ncbi:uncharacterized protein LOC144873087 [Branchiostoma floridae x Branchiostoma japonicum]
MSICSHFSTMEDIKTATTALKAVVELGYPLELSRVLDYLENLDSKDQLIQFDNEEGLCSFLKKFPSMFWVEGGNVFPAQMKPKGGLRCPNKTWLPQSQPIVQPGSNGSDERRQQDHPIGVVEEQVFAIDSNDLIHIQPSPTIEGSDDDDILSPSVSQSSSMEEDIDSADASNSSIELNGSLASQSSSSDEDTTNGRTDNAAIPEPHISSSEEDSDVECTQDVEALLEEGAAHIVDALEKKGSMPLGRIHGHVNQCKEEVRKAVGGGPEKARALFLKFPAYFFIDDHDDVHLTSKLTQECIKAVSATLERKGPLQVGELVSHIGPLEPKLSSFFDRNDPKTFLEQHSEIFVINKDDSMVYLVSAIKEEGVQHFQKVLKLKGSLHIKHICGHSSQYKYLGPMLKVIGGSPSSVMDFLKGFPEVFSVDDEGMVCLTSVSTAQSQGNKHVTEDKTYAMVVETGKKIQTNVPIRSPLQENRLGKGKSASSTAVVQNQEKTSRKDNKENILLEGVRHFKQVLESKGSMPILNISGHVNQCRDKVKQAIGFSADKVKIFLLRYPNVFHIDDKLIVHLVCNRAKKQQHQKKSNINQLQIEQKTLAHFKGMLSKKGPSTTHVLSSCFSSCGEDIRSHVGNSKEGLTKFFMKHPRIFKVDANNIVYLKGTSSSKSGSCSPHVESKVVKPQRWASCDTLAVPSSTVFPKSKLLSKLSGSTPDVRSTLCGGRLQHAEEVQGKHSHLPKEEYKDKDRTNSMAKSSSCAEQHSQGQKLDMSNNIYDEYVTAVKNILSKNGNLPLSKLVEELGVLFSRSFDLNGVTLFLKKHPDVFHVNNKDVVEELPPVNALAVITAVMTTFCFANLEDGSSVFMYIALYRERFGMGCHQLKDHLSPGDILLLDTEHSSTGSTTVKWAARSIKGLFKTSIAPSKINRANLQMPMPYLSATTVTRSPAELDEAIVNVLSAFLRVKSPLEIDVLSFRMRHMNHDAVLYLREKGGLIHFLQAHPQTFQVDNENVALTEGQPNSYQALKKGNNSASVTKAAKGDNDCSSNNQSSEAKSIIGEVSTIANNIVHLLLPDGKAAILKLTNVQDSVTTSCLNVGDSVVAYVVPAPDQSEIPWVVSKVRHVMGKAAPAQIHAKAATATCGSHLLKEVLRQCVLEEEVDAVLAWHQLLSKKRKVSFEGADECIRNLPKKAKLYMLQKGDTYMFLEQYPTLFHVDRVRKEISLMECSPVRKTVNFDGVKHVKNPPTQVEGMELVTEKPSVDTDKEAVKFFRSKVLEKGQVSIHELSSAFAFCPRAIRRHVGSSEKGVAKFLRAHPDTFSLNEDDMVCIVKDAFQTVKEQENTDQITHTGSAVLQEGNVQEDGDILPTQNASSSSCHHLFNPPVSHNIEMKPTVDEIDLVEKHQEPDEEEEGQVSVERETSELIFDLIHRCGQVSFRTLQGYVNLLGEDKQECIKDREGLLSFLQHHHGQTFRIDHVSENISIKMAQETRPDSLTNTADKEQHSSTEAVVKMEKTNNSISCDAENNKEHQDIREPGDATATSLLKSSHSTEDKHDGVDISTVVTPSELVTSETNVVVGASPDQIQNSQNQEQAGCDISTAVPTATVHPISVTNDSSSVPNTSDAENSNLSIDSNFNVAVQTEETGAQVSHTSTVEDMTALLPSSFDRSVVPPVRQEKTQAGTTSAPVQGKLLHLLVGEDGTHVWANSGEQDMQPLAAVCPAEFVVPGANPPGQPDDFTLLLPMFKDNLHTIQDNLVEVEMDIGRIPVARFYNPQTPCMLAATRLSDQTLTRETLETILFGLPLERSAISQGRVLLRGTLHWISTLKNSLGEIVGLTLRRGQAVPGCLDLLWDVVTSGTSTLIIGRPCSGKTTLLREWARVLSDVCYRRVIVVDTLKEIAGGDDIPHAGIGVARRVQVHNRCDQVSHLQTAARNHSPDCIIVDEVQTQEDVTALQAIRLTGIQVVAGVCAGCLTDLLQNSVMRGLLGLSDPAASTSAPLSGTFPQTLPVFQAAVVIHSRDMVSVYSDVASFVRVSLLEGRFPLAQQRKRVVTKDRETEL